MLTRSVHYLKTLVFWILLWGYLQMGSLPAWGRVDPYVNQYLQASQPIDLPFDATGKTVSLSPAQLTAGKALFQSNCLNCHVGGSTLPNPSISLSLSDLQAATPPRDNLSSLMQFQRQPLTYDGQALSEECRKISAAWIPDSQLENLAAFVLRAAQVAPGWGSKFEGD
ncbi:MAG: photosystem II cytochrome PsbV2 [Cyanobacteriota bacterium]|nr:photosystem II cytochrome PsbV2 [Cyanobacteriota bacterium]